MTIVPFRPRSKPEPGATVICDMVCERCGHEEEHFEAHVGRKFYLCPACNVMALRRAEPVLPEDGVGRESCPNCQGQAFAVMANALMCVDCGTEIPNGSEMT